MKRIDWERTLLDYRSSGKRQSDFARERNISASALNSRLRRERLNEGRFVRVDRSGKIELELSGGAVLKVLEGDLAKVLRALSER